MRPAGMTIAAWEFAPGDSILSLRRSEPKDPVWQLSIGCGELFDFDDLVLGHIRETLASLGRRPIDLEIHNPDGFAKANVLLQGRGAARASIIRKVFSCLVAKQRGGSH